MNSLFNNYFPNDKGFLVKMQSKLGRGLVDGSVTIFDPRSTKAVKPCLGLHGAFEKRNSIDLFHNISCLIEAKIEYDVRNTNAS
jgi:hypothetical protein